MTLPGLSPDKIEKLIDNTRALSNLVPIIQNDIGALLSRDDRLASLARVEALAALLGDFKDVILNIEEDFKILTNR